ncbi:pectinesterase inhibitor-like [Castanea sativa]|uniref:pectinesterase inhibitor-like n=1 Tax=Castanea sativa TaxID=21020 RepID=UPI003F64DF66
MAPSFCDSFFFSLLLAIRWICPTYARLSVMVSEHELKVICFSHEDAPFCLQALKFDPHTPLVDLVGLTNISIHLADVAANKTLALIRSLIKTTDSELKMHLDDCLEMYDITISETEDAKTALKAHDYETVNVASDSCMTNAETCTDTTTTSAPPLQQENKNMRYLCETFVVVSNHLL